MKSLTSVLLLAAPLVLWQCTTPPRPAAPPPVSTAPDDDHKAVSAAEFRGSRWTELPRATGWKEREGGVAITLTDGREVRLTFAAPGILRWQVPAAAGGTVAPAWARYEGVPVPAVKVTESAGVLTVASPSLSAEFRLADLSWTLKRGGKTLLTTAGGPRDAGRRLAQEILRDEGVPWSGPGLSAEVAEVRHWIGDPGSAGPFAVPSLGAPGPVAIQILLDTSYQSYTWVDAARIGLGALNGGLDLLISASPRPAAVVEGLTALTGRPDLPPFWAQGTALVLPAGEPGTFVRRAGLSIEVTAGPETPRAEGRFVPQSAGPTGLDLARNGRVDWTTTFDDGGRPALLAQMLPRLPALEAQALGEAKRAAQPLLRPLVLAASGGPGLVRWALPEFSVGPGTDDQALRRQALLLGLAGLGTPAGRLDLSALSDPVARPALLNRLAGWLLVPVLTLDWGPEPAAVWAALPEADRKTVKALLDRRSQLKPYLAQLARAATASGRPAWAPLWWAAPEDPQAQEAFDEFLFGDALLAAPASAAGADRKVYLPGPGVWFDYWSGQEFGGGRSYTVGTRVDRPVLFARGGAFLPVREPEVFDEKDIYNPLTVHVFPGGRGEGTYWVDDGTTVSWKAGAFQEVRLTYDFSQKEMSIEHQALNPSARVKADPYLLYRVHNVFRPRQVRIGGKAIPLFGDSWGITDTDRSAAWYESDHTLLIKTFRPERDQKIEISF